MPYMVGILWPGRASDPTTWRHNAKTLEISFSDPACSNRIQRFLRQVVAEHRASKVGAISTAEGACQGVGWTIPRRLLKSAATRRNTHAYRAVWQGQVLRSGNEVAAQCSCGALRSLRRLMYECPRNRPKRLSQAALTFRQKHQDACFWLRGMVFKEWTALAIKAEARRTEVTGIFAGEQAFDCSSLVIGADASGGPHTKDPRLRAVGWTAVLLNYGKENSWSLVPSQECFRPQLQCLKVST